MRSVHDLRPGDVVGLTAEGTLVLVVGAPEARARDLAQAEADVAQALADRAAARGYDAIVAAERAFDAAGRRCIALRTTVPA